MTDYPIRVLGGLPAIARVTSFVPYTPATWHAPAEGPEIEFEMLDCHGRQAPWIENRLTQEDRNAIASDLLELCDQEYREAREQYQYQTARTLWRF